MLTSVVDNTYPMFPRCLREFTCPTEKAPAADAEHPKANASKLPRLCPEAMPKGVPMSNNTRTYTRIVCNGRECDTYVQRHEYARVVCDGTDGPLPLPRPRPPPLPPILGVEAMPENEMLQLSKESKRVHGIETRRPELAIYVRVGPRRSAASKTRRRH